MDNLHATATYIVNINIYTLLNIPIGITSILVDNWNVSQVAMQLLTIIIWTFVHLGFDIWCNMHMF